MSTNATNKRKSNNLVNNNTNISEPNKLVQTSFNAAAKAINSAKTAFIKYLELQKALKNKQAYAALKTTMIKTQNAVIQTNNANSNLGAVVSQNVKPPVQFKAPNNATTSGIQNSNPLLQANAQQTIIVNPSEAPVNNNQSAQLLGNNTSVTVNNASQVKNQSVANANGGRRRRSNSKRKSSKKRQ